MKIANLNQRMAVMKPSRVPDGMGGYRTEYTQTTELWAEVLRPRFTGATIQGDAEAIVITQGIRLRRTGAVQRGDKVRVAGRLYDVLHVDDSVAGETTLTAREVRK